MTLPDTSDISNGYLLVQMSALLPGLGGDRGWNSGGEMAGAAGGELPDVRAVLETATAALEEIRSQVYARSPSMTALL